MGIVCYLTTDPIATKQNTYTSHTQSSSTQSCNDTSLHNLCEFVASSSTSSCVVCIALLMQLATTSTTTTTSTVVLFIIVFRRRDVFSSRLQLLAHKHSASSQSKAKRSSLARLLDSRKIQFQYLSQRVALSRITKSYAKLYAYRETGVLAYVLSVCATTTHITCATQLYLYDATCCPSRARKVVDGGFSIWLLYAHNISADYTIAHAHEHGLGDFVVVSWSEMAETLETTQHTQRCLLCLGIIMHTRRGNRTINDHVRVRVRSFGFFCLRACGVSGQSTQTRRPRRRNLLCVCEPQPHRAAPHS